MKRSWPIIVLVVVLIASWALFHFTSQPHQASVQARAETKAPQLVAAPTAGPIIDSNAAPSTALTRETTLPTDSTELADRELPYRVQILDSAGTTPIANATVFVLLPAKKGEPKPWGRKYCGRSPEESCSPDLRFTTDAVGLVDLPAPVRGQNIAAQSGDLFGYIETDRWTSSATPQIKLTLDPPIQLQLVDGDQQPVAGKDVGVVGFISSKLAARLVATTDAAGQATLFYPRHAMHQYFPGNVALSLIGQGLSPASAFQPFGDLPLQATLVMPKTGNVRLVFQNADGTEYTGQADVALTVKSEGPTAKTNHSLVWGEQTIEIADVALGASIEVRVTFDQERWNVLNLTTKGPLDPGQTKDIVLTCPFERRHFRLRFLSPKGLPLAKEVVRVDLMRRYKDGNSGRLSRVNYRCNEEGKFLVSFPLTSEKTGREGNTHAIYVEWVNPETQGLCQGTLEIKQPMSPGTEELQDLQLAKMPTVVAGTVVDGNDKPLPGVNVWAHLFHEPNTYGITLWAKTRYIKTDAEGRFRIHGAIPEENSKQAFLALRSNGQILENIPFDFGDTEKELVLVAGPYIVGGQVLLPERLTDNIYISFTSSAKDQGYMTSVLNQGSGPFKFHLNSNAIGSLRLTRASVSIITLPNIVPVPVEEWESRAMPVFDLRKRIAATTFVVYGKGERLTKYKVTQKGRRSANEVQNFSSENGKVYLTDAEQELVGKLTSSGYRTQEVNLAGGEHTLYLQPKLKVEVSLTNLPTLPDGLHLVSKFEPTSAETLDQAFSIYHTLNREQTKELQGPGLWKVSTFVSRRNADRSVDKQGLPLVGSHELWSTVEIEDSANLVQVMLDVRQEDVDAAVAKLPK